MSLSSAASGQSNDCGACTVLEGEPCIVDFGDDVTNGGCNTVTPCDVDTDCLSGLCVGDPNPGDGLAEGQCDPQWTAVTCGVTVCGVSSTYLFDLGPCDVDDDCGGGRTCDGDPNPGDGLPQGTCSSPGEARDTDWYRISKDDLDTASGGTGLLTVTATLTSEFEANLLILDIADCDNVTFLDFAQTNLACDVDTDCPSGLCVGDPTPGDGNPEGTCTGCASPATVDALINTADYLSGIAVFVSPQEFTGVACDVNDGYLLEITCEGHPADCNGDALNPCDEAANPNQTGCKDPECCILVCGTPGLTQCCTIRWDQACADAATDQCIFLPEPCPPLDEATCQLPQLLGSGGLPDDWFIGQNSDLAQGNRVADNFVAGETAQINQVCWWGFYDDSSAIPDCSATAVDDFTVTFYADDGNALPGAVIASFDALSGLVVNRTEDGVHEFEDDLGNPLPDQNLILYRYSAELPDSPVVGVDVGQCYWLEITNDLDGTCAWFWETASNNAGNDFDYSLLDDPNDLTGYDFNDARDIEMGWCLDIVLASVATCAPANPQEFCDPSGLIVLTQNNDPLTITPLNSIACVAANPDDPLDFWWTTDNYFARSYNLGTIDETMGQDIEVDCVRVAVALNDGSAYPLTINIYQDDDGGAPTHPDLDLTLLGTADVIIPVNTSLGFVEARFDPSVSVPADTVMVVELAMRDRIPGIVVCDLDADCDNFICIGDPIPGDGIAEGFCDTVFDGGGIWPGTNSLGVTESSYIRAPSPGCGAVNYLAMTVVAGNALDSQLVQEVHVKLACPCDCADGGDRVVNVVDFLALIGEWGGSGACDCADGGDGAAPTAATAS
jgi:hypothetical protein